MAKKFMAVHSIFKLQNLIKIQIKIANPAVEIRDISNNSVNVNKIWLNADSISQ